MEIEKPDDWNNHEDWERYFASLYPNGNFADACSWTGSISLDGIENLANGLKENNTEKIWIAGCGISLLPKALAQKGFEVYATDISPTAIAFQDSDDERVQELIDEQIKSKSEVNGSIHAEIQDFRQPYKKDFFDLIINTRAFQGFEKETMDAIARTHFEALKPSCQAVFDTINVQGERREMFEKSLVGAGFLIPFYELNCWYRQELNKTGFPFVFVLGNPIIPWHGIYAEDAAKHDKDMAILREITNKFRQKQQEELESEQEKLKDTQAKIASIIYSTG
jgi:2-polyprenyl-3-methyl-5-hydroxy-6-metoxy-1,4-benzoquinol methylase